jgi:hypothetical protein
MPPSSTRTLPNRLTSPQLLQVERDHELEAGEGSQEQQRAEVGPHERSGAQDAQPHEWVGRPPLDGDEDRHEGQAGGEHRGGGADALAGVLQAHHAVGEQQHRARDAQRAGDVEPAPWPDVLRGVPDQHDRGHEDHRGEDDRGEEHPAPADGGQQAAGDEAQREAAGGGAGVHAQGPGALRPLGEGAGDQRQPGGRHERGGDAGDEARHQQHPALRGEAAEPGEDEEDDEPQQEHPAVAEQVRRPAAQQHEAAVAQDVRAHHAAERPGRQPEVRPDRRQRHVQHGDVDPLQEDRPAQYEQHAPRPSVHAAACRRHD